MLSVLFVNLLARVEAHHHLWKDILADRTARNPGLINRWEKSGIWDICVAVGEPFEAEKGRPKPRSLARKEHWRGIERNSYHQVSGLHRVRSAYGDVWKKRFSFLFTTARTIVVVWSTTGSLAGRRSESLRRINEQKKSCPSASRFHLDQLKRETWKNRNLLVINANQQRRSSEDYWITLLWCGARWEVWGRPGHHCQEGGALVRDSEETTPEF